MNPKIVVIGAGASGIAAATKLIELGFKNIIILEAENRIGGRIYTVPFANNTIDVGAQWCHGEKDNVVFECVNKYSKNILEPSADRYSSFNCIRSNNKQVVQNDISTRLQNIIYELLQNAKDFLQQSTKSLGEYLENNYFEALKKDENIDIDETLAKEFFEFYHKFENSIEASDNLYEVSGKGYLQYWECEGNPLLNWKESGYVTFLNLLMKTSETLQYGLLENRIIFNAVVEEINYSSSTDKLIIKCSKKDEHIEADHVICTMSLGVLKENYKTLFKPKLSELKINTIKGLSFGTVNKIFIEFSKPFWPIDWPGFSILWNDNDLKAIRQRKDNWIEDVFGFYTVDYQKNILCGWISGRNGRKMEQNTVDEVLESCVFLLKKFLNWEISKIVALKRSTWYKKSNFRGSYSFRSMQTELLNVNASDLAAPIVNNNGKPLVQFAGEATHSHYYSTVHGATESGWREAQRINDFYSNQDNICDVLILGSGLAGLGAGYALRESNLNFKILEAQNYIGGRVLTEPLKDFQTKEISVLENYFGDSIRIDLGAQWLHGKDNILYEIAHKNNLIASEFSEEGLGSYIREDGYVFDDQFVKKIDFIVGQILQSCESFTESQKYPCSLGSFLKEKFLEYIEKLECPNDRTKALQLLDWHNRFQLIDNSCMNLNDLSAKFWGLYSYNGEPSQAHINLTKGFSSLIEALVQEIEDTKQHIFLQHEVIKINWNCYTNNNNNTNLIQVHCTNNQIFYAKHLIVTFSIGVLKYLEAKIFEPKLPEDLRKAIDILGFDVINKIFLKFENSWWNDRQGIQIVYSDEYLQLNQWTRYLSGFDIVNPGTQNTLIGWVGSSGAIAMEQLSDEQIIHDCIELLKMLTKQNVPYPIMYNCSRWGSNKYIKGGYSFISTNADKTSVERKLLSNPIKIEVNSSCTTTNNNILFQKVGNDVKSLSFAGEAYHDQFFSTAHGAFLSGIQQAEKIMKYL